MPWTINTSSDGDVVADALDGSAPSIARARTLSLRFIFWDDVDAVSAQTRYETLRSYGDYAASVQPFTAAGPTGHYREAPADNRSLLMSFTPPAGISTRGFWGVVTNVTDVTRLADEDRTLEFDVFVLAELSEFATREAVETARKL